ncbi:MAG: single-stranded-DNA-specific exonuclease RecJ [Gammaproteobacteria bacterium]
MKKKVIRRNSANSDALAQQGIHPVLARIYAARDIKRYDELSSSLSQLLPYQLLTGIEAASALLAEAIARQQRLLIVADFDADGATSCAVAIRALKLMGAKNVDYIVPNRFEYGYGLTREIVELALKRNPDLIITVDNGISSHEGVELAKHSGIKVLITDHHLPGSSLPVADAIVNPNLPGDQFPSKNLAGVGVIFYVMLSLRATLRVRDWFDEVGIEDPNLAQLLDLVALGTVADVVPLDQNNRILVSQGLARIRRNKCCAGVHQLLTIAQRQQSRTVAADLGFAIGPRLNAAGRLDDMSQGIECLLTDDQACASAIAARLDRLNRERRSIEADMQQQALEALNGLSLNTEHQYPSGIVLFDECWHQGVIGVLASRIKDRLHRPVIAFAPSAEGEIKGSARSVPGLHIRDILDSIATRYPELLAKFGGHAMAAGLSLKRGDLNTFKAVFDQEVAKHVDDEILQGVMMSDGGLMPDEMTLEVAELIRAGGPWGQGFPEPIFDGEFTVINKRIVADKHLKMVLGVPETEQMIDAIAFNTIPIDDNEKIKKINVVYKLDVNEFRGRTSPQLIVEQIS